MQKHRNPPNGFRSNPNGFGGFGGGVAAGGPGYRNYNLGGFGRGQPPPPRRIDVFMEAGKLAADYLVAKGLIPPDSGNSKWQNKNLKTPVGGGSGSGSATGSRDEIRVSRPMRSFKDPKAEMNREIKWSLSDKQGNSDLVSVSTEEQISEKDGVSEEQKLVSGEKPKSIEAGKLEETVVNRQSQSRDENEGVKTPVSDVSHRDCVESEDKSVDKNVNTSTNDAVMKDGDRESEKSVIVKEESSEEANNDAANNNRSDLLNLVRFNNVPTRTRSSVAPKGSKSDPVLISGDENKNTNLKSGESGNSISLQDDEKRVLKREPKIEEELMCKFGQGLHARSLSFPQRSSISEHELNKDNHELTRSSSAVLGRGEKRPLQNNDTAVLAKKYRDRASTNLQSNDYLQGRLGITQQCNFNVEEKQLFPSSSKICDLNLMGVSDVHENHGTNRVTGSSSFGQSKQEPVSVDFDLTMNSGGGGGGGGIADKHIRRGPDGKEVEVIDLDCDSVQNDNNNPERRDEAIFTDLGSFPESMPRVSDMRQDGYGLMMSDLLDADIPNSSVSTGVNSMPNEMSLQNEEGILDDDESIYMSLGEIPISMPQL
ncbi:uncharacterized protein At4g26450-like isoform X2 [Rutidosis leptorrhynchoides]|uniref:uncharacterized protein At4g26450-like isoform X2 n=1 Tax=Rutidosis leptorrhynchoides TaxID=125765 RepID=UPI003A99D879